MNSFSIFSALFFLLCVLSCNEGNEPGIEVCNNGVDDDGDGVADCNDADCVTFSGCSNREICDNGTDDDGDGVVDCSDADCNSFGNCTATGSGEICDNGVDDDGDGLIDCNDADCNSFNNCDGGSIVEICNNGRDDDGDGMIDCNDEDCNSYAECTSGACEVISMSFQGTWIGRYSVAGLLPLPNDETLDISVSGNLANVFSHIMQNSFLATFNSSTSQFEIAPFNASVFIIGNDTLYGVSLEEGVMILADDCNTLFVNYDNISVQSGTIDLSLINPGGDENGYPISSIDITTQSNDPFIKQ